MNYVVLKIHLLYVTLNSALTFLAACFAYFSNYQLIPYNPCVSWHLYKMYDSSWLNQTVCKCNNVRPIYLVIAWIHRTSSFVKDRANYCDSSWLDDQFPFPAVISHVIGVKRVDRGGPWETETTWSVILNKPCSFKKNTFSKIFSPFEITNFSLSSFPSVSSYSE